MKFDIDQAKAQLKALGYQQDETVYLRALGGPSGGIKFQALASKLPINEIERYQSQGYGIYFVVQGGGQRDIDAHDCRAVFYEHDDLGKEIQASLWQTLELPEPTIQIDTGGKSIHSYWVLTEPVISGQWRNLQTDLLKFADADRSLKNPSRVMRLAGAHHQATGQQSTIILNSGKRYSFDELRAIIPTEQAPQAPDAQPAEGKAEKKPPVFKLLMEIAEKCDLWHSDDGGVAYADVEIEGNRHTYPIRRKAFKTWLSSELYKRHETGANSEAMASCLNVLEAKATFEGQERKVFLRTGQGADGTVYIDLASPAWEVAKVTAAGWEGIASKDCPIRFSRNEGQLPLPNPERGGDLSKLWDVVAVNKNYRGLVLAWLAFCFVPNGSKPILTFHGAKGAGKSWATQVLKSLIDPGKAALLPAVGDRRGLAVAASNRWVLSYDNLTTLSTDQQDALCCAATGAGFSHRTLHTDLDETFIEYTRPQILTSVDLVPTRSDLLDRCLLIKLDRIPDNKRKTEAELKETLAALSRQSGTIRAGMLWSCQSGNLYLRC